MNLASKRMIALAALAASLFVLPASADGTKKDYVYDTFEPDETWTTVDWWQENSTANIQSQSISSLKTIRGDEFSILDYKKESAARVAWTTDKEDDNSSIVIDEDNPITWTNVTDTDTVPGKSHEAGAATSKGYLNLDTNGARLTRNFGYDQELVEGDTDTLTATAREATIDEGTADVYIDTMIKFTFSDEDPFNGVSDSGAQLALWVDKDGKLMVYCYNPTQEKYGSFEISNDLTINSEKWYRLTIKSSHNDDNYLALPAFSIWLNKTQLYSKDGGYSAEDDYEEGVTSEVAERIYFYPSADSISGGTTTIKQLAFQGTGNVDNVYIGEYAADFIGGGTAATITLSWGEGVANVVYGETTVASGDEVPQGTSVTVTPADWYVIAADKITGAEATIADNVATFTTGSDNITIADLAIESPVAGIAGESAKAWADAQEPKVAEADFSGYINQYLMNIKADQTAGLSITDIVPGAEGGATITIAATASKEGEEDEAVELDKINGVLYVYSAETLAELATAEPTAVTFTTDETGKAVVPVATGAFFKAKVDIAPVATEEAGE